MSKTKKVDVVMRVTEEYSKTIKVPKDALVGDIKDIACKDFQKNHYDNFDESWEYDYGIDTPQYEFVEYTDKE